MKYLASIFLITLLFLGFRMSAQDDLLDMLDDEVGNEKTEVAYTFKSTRIINGQSIERMKKRQLDFRVNHRFGEINSGAYELFGLDNALINLCFEYGLTDRIQIGFRRGTYQKTYDGSVKVSLFRQQTGKNAMPVAVSYFADAAINTLRITDPTREDKLTHRMAYTHQLLIARKFSEAISLQLSPSFVHKNEVAFNEVNDIYAMGLGGRFKITRRLSLTGEYFFSSNVMDNPAYYHPLALGFDLETGGHVFQLFLTNSRPMVEKGFISETTGNWGEGGIYFGFNISRVFAITKKDKHHED